jgi:thioredoxin-like negative regulator of GroEL
MTDLMSLDTLDLDTPHGVSVARNRFLRKARASQDKVAVDQILTTILSAQPDRLQEHIERVDNAVEMGDTAKAGVYLDALNAQFPDLTGQLGTRDAVLMLRSMLSLGHLERAVEMADRLRAGNQDARLGFIILKVYEEAGATDRILALAEDLYAQAGDRPDVRARLLSNLVDAGHTSKVFALLGDDLELTPDNIDVVLQVSRAHLRARPTDPRGLELLEDAYAFTPDREDVRVALSKGYLQFGRAKDALDILDLDPADPVTGKEGWRQHVAEVFMANNYFAQAGDVYRALARENPLHSGWRRAGIGALIQAGEQAKATAMYEEDRMRRRLSAHDRFEDRLHGLKDQLDQAPIPQVRFDWAYRKLQQLGAAPEDRQAWEDASRWVYLADILTIDWLETRTADADQLIDRIRDPEASLQPLRDCLDNGDGAFIAALHMGSMFAGPALMEAHGIDFRWLASTPAIATMPAGDKLLSTSSMSPVSIARSVFRAIRGGSAVTIAIDGGAPAVSRPISFLGDDILVTDMVPRTVLQTGARSFFPKMIWVGDELSLEFIELIPPAPDDTLEGYTSVWFRDFLECVGDMCIEAPDNMRLAGGFWTNLAL